MNEVTTVNSELLRKYNIPGPRYTSYPTVPYWETSPTEEQWVIALRKSLQQEKDKTAAAIYIHIPFCESLCTYCGCNTRITKNHALGTKYIHTLLTELDLYLEKIGIEGKLKVAEVHFGGGTPTFLRANELDTLMKGLHERLEMTANVEISLEAHPAVTTKEQLEVMRSHGCNRLSLGIQDYDPVVQDIVNRHQSPEQVTALTEAARQLGIVSINYDLIYGLPLQKLDSIRKTIKIVIEQRPDRIAFYSYAHVPWIKPGQRRFTEKDLPVAEEKRQLYELGRELLEEAGYREIGMDHFSLESDALWKATKDKTLHRNFMGYTPRFVAPLIGLGVSAIGDAFSAFAQNEKVLEKYEQRVEAGELPLLRGHLLDDEDLVLRQHILNLMTRLETSWQNENMQVPFLESVPQRLREMQLDGLIEVGPHYCRVYETGRPFLRNVCMAFDARLLRKAPETKLFSQTI